jgi:hypothetical protein
MRSKPIETIHETMMKSKLFFLIYFSFQINDIQRSNIVSEELTFVVRERESP